MKLSKFDGQRVHVTTAWGDELDGICSHNSADYNFHEFGRDEEGLQLTALLLFKSDIKKIKLLKNGFSTPFGKLEEIAVEDGADILEEVLFCEEDESVLRMLAYLERRCESEIPDREQTLDLVQQLFETTDSAEIKEAAERLLHAAESENGAK